MEPAGTNCADGGSKFTAANGVTYACNGAPGGGGGGPTGQNATSAYGTAAFSVFPTTTQTPVPGAADDLGSGRQRRLHRDRRGSSDDQLQYHRLLQPRRLRGITNVICGWSMSAAVPLNQGSYTFSVKASGVGSAGGAAAAVSGDSTSVNQGTLTVMVLKK